MPEMPIIMLLVFVAAFLGSGALVWLALQGTSTERKRLEAVTNRDGVQAPESAAATSLVENTSEKIKGAARFIPQSPKKLGHTRKRLAKAGYHSAGAAVFYLTSEIVLPIVLATIVLLVFGWYSGRLIALAALALGYLTPSFVLERMVTRRKRRISNGLPDALDLMIVCLEAGSGLDQAIVKTTEELSIAHPELAEELRLLTIETRAGKPRLDAFRNLASRTGVEDVRSLVSMLIQTDRFGTSIAQALRVHAETSRTKRRQRAEERAAKLGVKLVFPLVFCLFPAFYVVALGPAVIQFIKFFNKAA